jgi:hypothetical protein
MKAIIYAGIGLFSVASVYGVIDYYGAKKQGVLNNLYKEDAPDAAIDAKETTKKATAVLSNAVAANTPAVAVAKAPAVKKKKAKKEIRYVKFSDFSRGAIIRMPTPVPKPAVTAAAVEITASTSAEKVEEEKETIIEQPVKREPVNLKMFSRAPLKKKIRKEVPEKVTQQ